MENKKIPPLALTRSLFRQYPPFETGSLHEASLIVFAQYQPVCFGLRRLCVFLKGPCHPFCCRVQVQTHPETC